MALFLPVVIALQFFLTLSVGFFLATLHVSLRDTQYLVGISLLLGFYLTPVFFPIQLRFHALSDAFSTKPHAAHYRSLSLTAAFAPATTTLPVNDDRLVGWYSAWLTHRRFVHASYFFIEEL